MNPEEIYIRQFKDCDLFGLTELLNDLENQENYLTDKIKAKFQIVIILLFRKY